MLEPDDLIQDEREFLEQTEQLQKGYVQSRIDQQSLLRIRMRLLEQSAQRNRMGENVLNQQQQFKMAPTGQPVMGQMMPPANDQQPKQQKKRPAYTWRLVALVAVLCIVILSGVMYGLHSYADFLKPVGQSVASPTVTTPVPLYGIINVRSVTMTSRTTGWGVGVIIEKNDRTRTTIVRTTNGGKTWQPFDFGDWEVGLMGHVFLDNQTAWLVMAAGGDRQSKAPLMHTTDGGKHWTQLSMPPGMINMMFVDQQHGWAWSDSGVQTFYRTMDAGKTWGEVQHPFSGYFGLRFTNPQLGWASVHTDSKQALLYKTQDGGITWQLQTLPEPASGALPGIHIPAQEDAYFTIGYPKFVTPQHALLYVASQENKESARTIYLYESNDSGQSWSLLDSPIEGKSEPKFPMILDEKHILLVTQRTLTVTVLEDGQWKVQGVSDITGDILMESIFFIDSQHGWVGTSGITNGKNTFRWYETTDGGVSWREVMRSVTDLSPINSGG